MIGRGGVCAGVAVNKWLCRRVFLGGVCLSVIDCMRCFSVMFGCVVYAHVCRYEQMSFRACLDTNSNSRPLTLR